MRVGHRQAFITKTLGVTTEGFFLTVPIHIDRDDPKFSLIDKNYLLDAVKGDRSIPKPALSQN